MVTTKLSGFVLLLFSVAVWGQTAPVRNAQPGIKPSPMVQRPSAPAQQSVVTSSNYYRPPATPAPVADAAGRGGRGAAGRVALSAIPPVTPQLARVPQSFAPATPVAAAVAPMQPLAVPAMPVAPPANKEEAIRVEFHQGLLTVMAENAELGKVLHLIGAKTGAEVEVAPELSNEPVVAHLGPGSPNEILSLMLNSPRIDFILMGSDEVGVVRRLLVRRKASFGTEASAHRPHQQPQEAMDRHNAAVEAAANADEAAQPEQQNGVTESTAEAAQNPQQEASQAAPPQQ
ncbi:MAG TPA: hypothetical protein VFI72_06280 [Candidatus Angelobacter sp.]|nr:hypothetical protein [Candidatus Angelobacter sp.]